MRQPTDSLSAPAVVGRPSAPPGWAEVMAALEAEPWSHDFFATLRRIETLRPDLPRLGHAAVPGQEPVRIGQEPTLAFAPAVFSALEAATDHTPPRLRQAFFGYIGPNGPLPVHLSDFVRERVVQAGDHTLLHFLDQFAHRFALHLYRAWAQARPTVGLDRPQEDDFRRRVGAFAGMGSPGRQEKDRFNDDARLYFSGWMLRQVRNQESIEAVLSGYFGVGVEVQPWEGHWEVLEPDQCSRLGLGCQPLGRGAMLGTRVWDRQHRINLRLGPMGLAQYTDFLPDGTAFARLCDWMQHLLGDEFAWSLTLVVRHREVPQTRLGQRLGNGARLGWTSWLAQHGQRTRDADEVRLPMARRGGRAFRSRH